MRSARDLVAAALVVACGSCRGALPRGDVRAAPIAEVGPTQLPLIPWPADVRRGVGELTLPASPSICAPADSDAAGVGLLLAEALAGEVRAGPAARRRRPEEPAGRGVPLPRGELRERR